MALEEAAYSTVDSGVGRFGCLLVTVFGNGGGARGRGGGFSSGFLYAAWHVRARTETRAHVPYARGVGSIPDAA